MVKERAIVLRRLKHGEADLIVHCLNEQGTKVSLFAKSAIKSRKRFGGGVLEPTHLIYICYKKPNITEHLAKLVFSVKDLRMYKVN